ncbi:MAG: Z1 domain-containing protein, partial [Candidatus Woesearchaeota archaeon]
KKEIAEKIHLIIKTTPILVTNSKEKTIIDWRTHYSRILVGGQILDRGFTVEGLNVTYMPRSIGVGNADTIQQRCRFFGYKKDYESMCKIYLPRTTTRAYHDYVLHEEDLRKKLIDFGGTEKSLKEFKREFFLSPVLKLTRRNILSDDIKRYRLIGWRPILDIDDNYIFNNNIIIGFTEKLSFYHSDFSGNTEEQKHQECEVSSDLLINDLLTELSYKNASNSLLLNNIISLIGLISDNPNNKIKVINMKCGLFRDRGLSKKNNNEISQLFQGSNKATNYFGDRTVKSEKDITMQIHHLKVKNKNLIFRTIAFHIPENHGQYILAQL